MEAKLEARRTPKEPNMGTLDSRRSRSGCHATRQSRVAARTEEKGGGGVQVREGSRTNQC
jgi:hypothetical protein